MDNNQIIIKTKEYVRSVLEGEGSGHDWWHIFGVWNNAKHIALKEKLLYQMLMMKKSSHLV